MPSRSTTRIEIRNRNEEEDDDILQMDVPDASELVGLPVHQMFLLEGLVDDPGLVLQCLFFLVQRRDSRIGRVQIQFIAAVLLFQSNRVRTFGQAADLLFFRSQLLVDALDFPRDNVSHRPDAVEGTRFDSL